MSANTLRLSKHIQKFDWLLAVAMLLSSAAGLVLVYTATYSYGTARYLLVQACAVVLGYLGMLAVSRLDYGLLLRAAPALYAAMVAALFLTALTADTVKGNSNWLQLGSVSLQTSELMKVFFVLTLTAHLEKVGERLGELRHVLGLLLHLLLVVVPIALQKDLGMVVVYLFIFAVMLFAAGLPARYWALALLLALPAARWCWLYLLGDYQRGRLLAAVDPNLDPLGVGYQAIQSRIAIGAGGTSGAGFLQGVQTQTSMLPEKHTDFIFSVAAEEFGLWGALAVLVLLAFLCLRVLAAARRAKDRGGYLICMGVFASLMFQTVENIGMCLGVLPVVGLTLPLFSYGGSSVVSIYLSVGLVQAVTVRARTGSFIVEQQE